MWLPDLVTKTRNEWDQFMLLETYLCETYLVGEHRLEGQRSLVKSTVSALSKSNKGEKRH